MIVEVVCNKTRMLSNVVGSSGEGGGVIVFSFYFLSSVFRE